MPDRRPVGELIHAIDAAHDESQYELRTLVTVSRAHPKDIGQRQVVVRIDDGPKRTLLFGESFTEELQPGCHRLRVHNTLVWKTRTFHVEAGEHLEFIVLNRAGAMTLGLWALFGVGPLYLSIFKRSRQ